MISLKSLTNKIEAKNSLFECCMFKQLTSWLDQYADEAATVSVFVVSYFIMDYFQSATQRYSLDETGIAVFSLAVTIIVVYIRKKILK